MLVQNCTSLPSLSLILVIGILQSACAVTSGNARLQLDAAPFDRLSPHVALEGVQVKANTSLATNVDKKREASALIVAVASSNLRSETPESARTEASAPSESAVESSDDTTEGTMCLEPSGLRQRAEVNPEFWEALECGQSNHYLGAQIGFGSAIASLAVLSLVASVSGERVTQGPAVLGGITIPPALLAGRSDGFTVASLRVSVAESVALRDSRRVSRRWRSGWLSTSSGKQR